MVWSGGWKWDNCNSIINKYILKKEKRKKMFKWFTRAFEKNLCSVTAIQISKLFLTQLL